MSLADRTVSAGLRARLKRWPGKAPGEVLDYALDWSSLDENEAINSSAWIAPPGLTIDSDEHDAHSTTLWLSGGSSGKIYSLLNRIHTSRARVIEQRVEIAVVPR
jgi:hypothetical protein